VAREVVGAHRLLQPAHAPVGVMVRAADRLRHREDLVRIDEDAHALADRPAHGAEHLALRVQGGMAELELDGAEARRHGLARLLGQIGGRPGAQAGVGRDALVAPSSRASGRPRARAWASQAAMSRAASAMPTKPWVPSSRKCLPSVRESMAGASGCPAAKRPRLAVIAAAGARAADV